MQVIRLSVFAAFVLALSGCAPTIEEPAPKVPAGGVLLKGAGATFPSALYKKWFAVYQADHAATVITYDAVGSGEGIRRFLASNVKDEERVDFAASDAALSDQEIAQTPNGALLIPITAGSVVLAYDLPDFRGELRLSREAYSGIFLGEITSWNDPRIARANPGVRLPKLTIAPVVRQDASGTTFAFTKHLDAISEKWRARFGAATLVNWPGAAIRAKGNEGVAGQIQHSVGSIGYVGLEFARKLDLHAATLENREGGYVAPSEQSAARALASSEMPENLRLFIPDPSGYDSYPIVTFSWILVYKHYADSAKATALRDLFRWCLAGGQQYAPESGYVRLPENVVASARTALNAVAPFD